MNAPHLSFLISALFNVEGVNGIVVMMMYGDCVRRQMGKCNYGCFRALGGKKTCHKGEQEAKTAPFVM